MLLAIAYGSILWFYKISASHAATIPASDGGLINAAASLINISSPSSLSIASPFLNATEIRCSGRQFGANLRYTSCLDAFATFGGGQSDESVELGRRGTGAGTGAYAVNLPWKWVSGTILASFIDSVHD